MTNQLPQLTDEQRAENLRRAAEARRARAEARARLASGEATLADALASDEEALRRMPVRSLLTALPGIGRARADRVMAGLGISPARRVRGLGPNQRAALLAWWDAR